MNKFDLFSRLSRGYGTWDGIAKREPVESDSVSVVVCLSLKVPKQNLHLPK